MFNKPAATGSGIAPPPSIWFETLPIFENQLSGDFTCDTAVVGGGITGISAAYHLARAGQHVVVLERYGIGEGSSGLSGGFTAATSSWDLRTLIAMRGENDGKAIFDSIIHAIAGMEHVMQKEKIECGFQRNHSLYFAAERSHVGVLEEEYKWRAKMGYHAELYAAGDARIPVAGAYGALKTFGDASLNPAAFVRGVAIAVVRYGGEVFTHTCVVKVEEDGDGITAWTAKGNRVQAKHTVVATNGWHDLLKAMPHLKYVSVPYVSHMIVTEPVRGIEEKWRGELLWDTYEVYHYLRLLEDGRILIGGEDRWFGEPYHGSLPGSSRYHRRLLNKLREYFPDFEITCSRGWSGYLADPIDGLPFMETRGRVTAAIVDGLPIGWSVGQAISDRIVRNHSALDVLYDAVHRKLGFWRRLFVRTPLPSRFKEILLKIAVVVVRALDELDKKFRY